MLCIVRSIDVITKPIGEGQPTKDYAALLSEFKGNCKYNSLVQQSASA